VLARVLDDAEAVASSLIGVGMNAAGLGDYERAAAAYMEGAELARAGGYTWFLAVAIGNLGDLALEQGDYAHARALTEESLGLFRQLGDERKIVERVVELGIVASREGRSDEAETLLRESLEYAHALVDKELAIWCLGELAALALSKGEAERAARLMGAIESLREETGLASFPDERRVGEQTRNALASALGEEHLAAALAIGREMTFEQAVAYALQS
jgi:tetratricopeptide (TPR) repeat protein